MFATTIRFTMPADTNWEGLRQLAIRRAFEIYRTIPGLRAKAFIFSPEQGQFGGNYLWETQDHAEAFLRSAAWQTAVSLYGEPHIERAEVCAYVEDGDLVFPPDYEVRPASSAVEHASPSSGQAG
jgi:hypothetical protein